MEEEGEECDFDQEESEEAESSDDSAPQFSQIKHWIKLRENPKNNEDDESIYPQISTTDENKTAKWIKSTDKINRNLQASAFAL